MIYIYIYITNLKLRAVKFSPNSSTVFMWPVSKLSALRYSVAFACSVRKVVAVYDRTCCCHTSSVTTFLSPLITLKAAERNGSFTLFIWTPSDLQLFSFTSHEAEFVAVGIFWAVKCVLKDVPNNLFGPLVRTGSSSGAMCSNDVSERLCPSTHVDGHLCVGAE